MKFLPALFLLIVPFRGFGSSVEWQLRHSARTSERNLLEPAFVFGKELTTWFSFETGGRAGISRLGADELTAGGAGKVHFRDFLSLSARASQSIFFQEGFGATEFLVLPELKLFPISFLGFSAAIGGYARYHNLTGVLPTVGGVNHDYDLAASLSLHLKPVERVYIVTRLSTYDEFRVFNLNNPFAELAIQYALESDLIVRGFFRYRVLLGFGKLDEFLSGVGVGWRI